MNRFILMLAFFVLAIIAPVSSVNADVIDKSPPGTELTIDVITVDATEVADIVITLLEFEKTDIKNFENVIIGGDCRLCGKQVTNTIYVTNQIQKHNKLSANKLSKSEIAIYQKYHSTGGYLNRIWYT